MNSEVIEAGNYVNLNKLKDSQRLLLSTMVEDEKQIVAYNSISQ
jgi:hypothetical protein